MRGALKICGIVLVGALSGCQTIDDITQLVASGVSVVKEQFSSANANSTNETQPTKVYPDGDAKNDEQSKITTGYLSHDAIVDGDTIHLGGRKVRLFGIDAPELSQPCISHGKTTSCGVTAKNALIGFTAGAKVSCVRKETDKYGRDVSLCFADEADLSAVMVRSGMAVAYRKYSLAYVPEEDAAKSHKSGIWSGTFTMPWDWRSQRKNKR